MNSVHPLKPSKQTNLNKPVFGFDIETAGNDNVFIMGSVSDGNRCETFLDKFEFCEQFKRKRYRNSFIFATNLGFDFFGSFHDHPQEKEFDLLFRGSSLICSRTHVTSQGFSSKILRDTKGRSNDTITFLDTGNYAPLSVEKWGKLLGELKLKESVSDMLGRMPRNKQEWAILERYNQQDAMISQKAARFLLDSFQVMGASPKMTIGSTAMSLFRNKYLTKTVFQIPPQHISWMMQGIYGGNTHAYSRGTIGPGYRYYDINSLYPTCMLNEFPDISQMRFTESNTDRYIWKYHGMSEVTIHVPRTAYPFLPVHHDGKMLMPCGTLRGRWTHIEIRRAIDLGGRLVRVHRCYYFPKTWHPFKGYVEDLYKKRLQYQKEGSVMEFIVKLLLNSLYGKFGQRFTGRDNMIYANMSIEELNKYHSFEVVGKFIRITQDTDPAPFCIPVWAAMITAYARIMLHDLILKSDPVYVDTDSIVTKRTMPTSDKLGDLKKVMDIRDGVIVRPKFYMFTPMGDDRPMVKIKGVGLRMNVPQFYELLLKGRVSYRKFMKIRESARRGFHPNRIMDVIKDIGFEDDKREWPAAFSIDGMQDSAAPIMRCNDGVNVRV